MTDKKTTISDLIKRQMKNSGQGMTRPNGTKKSNTGYLGQVKRDDGSVMTEYSTNVDDINAAFGDSKFSHIDERGIKVVGFPTLVPTLTKEEVETLRTLPEGERIPREIIIKAADHAAMKLNKGESPFYQDKKQSSLLSNKDKKIKKNKSLIQ